MSSGRHLRRSIRRHKPNERVAFVVGWCLDEDDLPDTRKGTHDAVIALMGDQRTGPVTWSQFTGFDALAFLQRASADATDDRQPLRDHYAKLRDLLVAQGGWLVVASAPGKTPPGMLRR